MILPTEHWSEGPTLSPALMSEFRTEQMGLSETMRSSSVEGEGGFQDRLSEKPNAEEPSMGSSGCKRKRQNEVHVFTQLSRRGLRRPRVRLGWTREGQKHGRVGDAPL